MTIGTILSSLRAQFIRNVILGFLIAITLLMIWKVLQFTGITALVPLAGGWVEYIGLPPLAGHVAAVIVTVLVVGVLGLCVRTFVGSLRGRFPLLSQVLSAEEQLHTILRSGQTARRDCVVLVDWPTAEVRAIGIIAGQTVHERTGRELALVYIPNTPNPTGGILRVVDRKRLTVTSLSIAEACALCFSRGAATGKKFEGRIRTMGAESIE